MRCNPSRSIRRVAASPRRSGSVTLPSRSRLPGAARAQTQNEYLRTGDNDEAIVQAVLTAFGRVGHWFASERYDIRPDIVCCAKGLSSAYAAIGAVNLDDARGHFLVGLEHVLDFIHVIFGDL